MLFNQKLPSQFFLFLLCFFFKIQAKINSQIFAKQKKLQALRYQAFTYNLAR